jgi:hypothetical protein
MRLPLTRGLGGFWEDFEELLRLTLKNPLRLMRLCEKYP